MHSEEQAPDRHQGWWTINQGWLRHGVVLVQITGRLDRLAGSRLMHVLDQHLRGCPWAIVLDLSEATDLAADVVVCLEHIAYQAGEADIGLYIVAVQRVRQALTAARGRALFDIYPTVDAAGPALIGGDQLRSPDSSKPGEWPAPRTPHRSTTGPRSFP